MFDTLNMLSVISKLFHFKRLSYIKQTNSIVEEVTSEFLEFPIMSIGLSILFSSRPVAFLPAGSRFSVAKQRQLQ